MLANDSDVDGNSLTAVLVTSPANGALTLNANGSFSYVPANNYIGADSFGYRANDGTTNSATATVTLSILAPPNTAPVAQADSYSTLKNTVLNVAAAGVLANDSDVDGTALTAVLVSSPTHGTLTLNASGSFSYIPANNYLGSDSFGYRAQDGFTNSVTATVTITILALPNSTPVALSNSYALLKNTTLLVEAASGVLTNDSDADGDALTALLVTGPTHGTLSLNADGGFNYTPANNYVGSDSFSYKAGDGLTNSAPATVALTISAPPNSAPVAQADSYAMLKNTALNVAAVGVLANDSDVDGNALTAVLVTLPTHGTLSLNANGSFNYAPANNYVGFDSFTYRANDGTTNSAPATVTITIAAPPNSAPVALADSYSTLRNTALNVAAAGVLANDSDVDGNALTAVLLIAPTHGALTLNANGSFNFVPANNYLGSDSFTYRANDGATNSAAATVTIAILAPPNSAPVAVSNSYTTLKNTALNVAASSGVLTNDSDVDGDALTAFVAAAPAHGTLTLNANGSFLYLPTTNFIGTDSFGYRVSDGFANSGIATVSITILAPPNSAPVAQADSYATFKNTALNVAAVSGVLANDADADGNPLTATLFTPPAHGTLTFNPNGGFLYTPAANFTGLDTFNYRASDGLALSVSTTVTIAINEPPHTNTPPVAQGDYFVTTRNRPLEVFWWLGVLLNDSDADADALTAGLYSSPAHGTVSLDLDGGFVYVPATNFTGVDSFQYRASDNLAYSGAATVTIVVNEPPRTNSAPVAKPDSYTTTKNRPVHAFAGSGVLANDTDADGEPLNAVLLIAPAFGTVTLEDDGSFVYRPVTDFIGMDSFQYVATDGSAFSAATTVSITVNGTPRTNTAPVALADQYATTRNSPLTIFGPSGVLANDRDTDNDSLTAVLVSAPTNGTVTLNDDGSFAYTPAADFTGVDFFTYVASDGLASSAETRVSIDVNAAPTAQTDNYFTSKNAPLNVAASSGVLLNDSDANGDALTATLVVGTSHGTITLNADGSFLYTPETDFTGTDSFVYQASDGSALSATRFVTISVSESTSAGACTACFAALDEILAARSNAFTTVIAAWRAVPTNASCAQYHVLLFRTLSKSLQPLHDTAANQALAQAADCVSLELQDELNLRSAQVAAMFPSKYTTSASNYIAVGWHNLEMVMTSTNNSSRGKYLAAAALTLPRADRSTASGTLAPASLASRSIDALVVQHGQTERVGFLFLENTFVVLNTDGVAIATGSYTYARTAYNYGTISIVLDANPVLGYAAYESVRLDLKFTRTRSRLTGPGLRGYFVWQ